MHDDVTPVFELARYLRREEFVLDDAVAFMAALSMAAELAEQTPSPIDVAFPGPDDNADGLISRRCGTKLDPSGDSAWEATWVRSSRAI